MLITSCVTGTKTQITSAAGIDNMLREAKRSFVKIEVSAFLTHCTEEDNGKKECIKQLVGTASGSGSIVKYRGKKHILTVAHVCSNEELEFKAMLAAATVNYDLFSLKEGYSSDKYDLAVVKIDKENDLCLLKSVDYLDMVGDPILKISSREPEYAEHIYSVASPIGVAEEGMVPILEGRFAGNKFNRAYYTVPAAGGSSGSPLLNSEGRIVGVTHSVLIYFHHISVSSTYKALWNFLH